MKLINKLLSAALPLFLGAAALTGCSDKDNAVPTDTVDTLISSNANLTIFKAALEKTGMNSFTKGNGPFTYFIPNDDAFKASGINSAADLNALDPNLLTQTIAYHIGAGARTEVEIPAGPNAPATTVGGLSIYASKNNNGTFINGSRIVQADIKGSNGIVHVIDRVLAPPFANMLATLSANPDYKLFVQGIAKAGINSTFSGTTVYTVFAPTNAAMTAAGYDSTTIANLTGAALTSFTANLRYHLITGRLFSSEFKDASLKTVQGSLIALSVSGGNKVKGIANPTPASITTTDWLTSNGVIHSVDAVLKY